MGQLRSKLKNRIIVACLSGAFLIIALVVATVFYLSAEVTLSPDAADTYLKRVFGEIQLPELQVERSHVDGGRDGATWMAIRVKPKAVDEIRHRLKELWLKQKEQASVEEKIDVIETTTDLHLYTDSVEKPAWWAPEKMQEAASFIYVHRLPRARGWAVTFSKDGRILIYGWTS